MAPATPTKTESPEEVGGAKEAPALEAATVGVMIRETIQSLIAKYLFEGKWKIVAFPN